MSQRPRSSSLAGDAQATRGKRSAQTVRRSALAIALICISVCPSALIAQRRTERDSLSVWRSAIAGGVTAIFGEEGTYDGKHIGALLLARVNGTTYVRSSLRGYFFGVKPLTYQALLGDSTSPATLHRNVAQATLGIQTYGGTSTRWPPYAFLAASGSLSHRTLTNPNCTGAAICPRFVSDATDRNIGLEFGIGGEGPFLSAIVHSEISVFWPLIWSRRLDPRQRFWILPLTAGITF